jgi:transcriptional regulator with XRE-family HTH domain
MKTVSEIIREAMIATGKTDGQISRDIPVSQVQLWKFRNGRTVPLASTIDSLASWLGLTVAPIATAPAAKTAPKKASSRRGASRRRSSPPTRIRGASSEPKPK